MTLINGALADGVLAGDLHLRGSGDPKLTIEALWLWMREMRARGLREIRGDIVLDRSLLDLGTPDPGGFVALPLRAYNVIPDALLLNFKALQLTFVPGPGQGVAVLAEPLPAQLEVLRLLKAVDGGCDNWRGGLRYDLTTQGERARLVFTGTYPSSCGEKSWSLAPLDHRQYDESLIRELWREIGGMLGGTVRDGAVPPGAQLFSSHESPALASALLLLPCWATLGPSRPVAAADGRPVSAYTARLSVDAGVADRPRLQPELFGIAWNWTDSGGGLMEYGELLGDRSFRNQDAVMARAWVESPNAQTRGRVRHVSSGGHDKPWGGRAYPGLMRLSQEALGYTCISQQLGEPVDVGAQYELHLSARAEGAGGAALSVFFADPHFTPIEKLDKLAAVTANSWADYRFVLTPEKGQNGAFLRICLASPGELWVDEVRLRRLGGELRVRDRAAARIQELGVRSLRWPTGSDADTFEWRDSIGPWSRAG